MIKEKKCPKKKVQGNRILRQRNALLGDEWANSITDGWSDTDWRHMRSELREAQWDEVPLMRLARSVSLRDMEELHWLWRELDEPRIQRLSRDEGEALLLKWQETAGIPGHFDCAICGGSFPKGEHSIEHVVPRAELEINSLDNHVLTCKGNGRCNEIRGSRFSLLGATEELAKRRMLVNRNRAREALYRVRRMVLLIIYMSMWIDADVDEEKGEK